jgi:2-polyprenyl-3-methyl-5-hydroxy-6-metoxy-1,4-benzoquinol methylase
MGRLLNLVTPLHRSTKRDYVARMMDEKVHCMLKAKEYEGDYWDGDRRYGYGGYRYIEGRWAPVAQGLIDLHGLKGKVRILDVGCGKGYLLREFQRLLPEADLVGFDISKHTICSATGRRTAIRSATSRLTSWYRWAGYTISRSSS